MGGSSARLDSAINMSIGHITWGDGRGKQPLTCDGRAWNSISFSPSKKFLYAANGNKLRLGATLDIEKQRNVLFHNLITLLTTAIHAKVFSMCDCMNKKLRVK